LIHKIISIYADLYERNRRGHTPGNCITFLEAGKEGIRHKAGDRGIVDYVDKSMSISIKGHCEKEGLEDNQAGKAIFALDTSACGPQED
jgi:hypothetical protein